MSFFFFLRFTGHQNHEYKVDSTLNCQDTHVISGSEDGFVYYWDLVEVCKRCIESIRKLKFSAYTVLELLCTHTDIMTREHLII